MAKLNIVEGNFALVPAGNTARKWVADGGSLTGTVYQRAAGAATVTDDGIVIEVYTTREHAEKAIDPVVQETRRIAKDRSGAHWD